MKKYRKAHSFLEQLQKQMNLPTNIIATHLSSKVGRGDKFMSGLYVVVVSQVIWASLMRIQRGKYPHLEYHVISTPSPPFPVKPRNYYTEH